MVAAVAMDVVAAAAMVVAAVAEAAAGSGVAEVAAVVAVAGSVASGSAPAWAARVAQAAAYPGERAACAKSLNLTVGFAEDAVIGLEAPQAPKRRLLPGATNTIARRGGRSWP